MAFFVRFPDHQAFVFGRQRAFGPACRVRALTQDVADDPVAFPGAPRFALPADSLLPGHSAAQEARLPQSAPYSMQEIFIDK